MKQKWSELLSKFPDEDIDWIMSSGKDCLITSETVLISENTGIDYLYFVIKGLLKVTTAISGDRTIALLGPGEIIGELSFVDNKKTVATVVADEDSSIFAIERNFLRELIENDKGFGLRWYRALCEVTVHRLRTTTNELGKMLQHTGHELCFDIKEWTMLKQEIDAFKELAADVDKRALKTHNLVPDEDVKVIRKKHKELTTHLNDIFTESTKIPEPLKCEICRKVQNELLPLVLLTKTVERFYSKPRGYAGDYVTIDRIYKNKPEGHGRIGAVIDSCIMNEPAGNAVRYRRKLFADEIIKTVNSKNGEVTRITCIASGPATEIFDAFDLLEEKSKLQSNLIDFDLHALSFVEKILNDKKLEKQANLINENILYLVLGRKKVDITDQDLVYSIGLIDYLNDKVVIKLINFIYDILAPGSRVILGNFHPRNKTRAFMDHVLEWKLIHRTEDDMHSLFKSSKFKTPCSNITFEPEGINLFAECKRV